MGVRAPPRQWVSQPQRVDRARQPAQGARRRRCHRARVIEVGATLADSVTFAVGADPARIAWAVDHAQLARKQARLGPSMLKLGAFLNVVVNPDFDRARAMARGTVGVFSHFSGMSRDSTAGMRPEGRAVAQKAGESYDMSCHTRSDAGHAQFIDGPSSIGSQSLDLPLIA
jgi:hypothetical protein